MNIWLTIIFFFIVGYEGLCLPSEKFTLETGFSTVSLHVFTYFRIFCSPCAMNCMKVNVLARAQMNFFIWSLQDHVLKLLERVYSCFLHQLFFMCCLYQVTKYFNCFLNGCLYLKIVTSTLRDEFLGDIW